MPLVDRLLAHPMTRELDLDAPETTAIRRELIRSKPFLSQLYLDWYTNIVARLPDTLGEVVEIGAGGGFFDEVLPGLTTTEVFAVPGIDLVADARHLPFVDNSIAAILMTNVFHHIPDVAQFLDEAERVLTPGGRIVMVEPWNTGWSRFVHKRLHDEPMIPDAPRWEFPSSGPVSGANAALAWIVVERDRQRLETEWGFEVLEAKPIMPFSYLVSGGVSLRSLQPRWMYPFWAWIDRLSILKSFAIFAIVVLERRR